MINTQELSSLIEGELDVTKETLTRVSHDASLFEVIPQAVVFPKNVEDLKKLVKYANGRNDQAGQFSSLSGDSNDLKPRITLTARAAGTDMSGGPLTESIVLEFTRYFNHIKEVKEGSSLLSSPRMRGSLGSIAVENKIEISGYAVTEPGVYYRDFDKATVEKGGQIMPSYPASRELCTVGGMVANNAGGEKTLTYGKTENYVRRLKMVCADGNEYEFRPLTGEELEAKKRPRSFEGEIYRRMHDLISSNYDLLQKAKPIVSKNSCGYFLWNVISNATNITLAAPRSREGFPFFAELAKRKEGKTPSGDRGTGSFTEIKDEKIFDLTKMIVGSQGTLGLITEIEFALVKPKKFSHLLVVFLTDLNQLGETATHILEHKPESFESYDDQTLKIAIKFLPQLMKQMGGSIVTLGLEFIPEILSVLEGGGLPKLVLMAEFTADSDAEALDKAQAARSSLKALHERMRVTKTEQDEHKYWVIRRESFNMLRKHIHGARTAPFIDDFVVPPTSLPEFLPKLYAILAEYKDDLIYTIAGHVGDGNFHIIPLMDMKIERSREIIRELSVKVYELVREFHGSISGEHNDGIIRTPFVVMQYGKEVCKLFEETKKIWDPKGIFNPGKKVGGTMEYAMEHLVKES